MTVPLAAQPLTQTAHASPHGVYTFLATTIIGGAVQAEVPLVAVTYGFEVGWGCKSLTGTIPLYDRTLFAADSDRRDVLLAVRKWRSGLYVLRDGVVQWGGIVTSVLPDQDDGVTVTAQGMLAYLNRRVVTDDLTYGQGATTDDAGVTWTGVGQLLIATALVAAAQSDPHGDVGIVVPSVGTQTPRDQTYLWSDVKPIGEALTDLSAVDGGFELRFDASAASNGTPQVRMVLGAPTLGRTLDQTGLVFEAPGNLITAAQWSDPRIDVASHQIDIGQGDGHSGLRSTATNATLLAAGYPRIDASAGLTDVSDQDTLDAHTTADLALAGNTLPIPELATFATDPQLGTYAVGDQVRYRETSPAWPALPAGGAGLDITCRITAYTVAVPDDAGDERVTHTLNPVEAVIA